MHRVSRPRELGQPYGPAQEITCSKARAKEEKMKRAREEKEKDQEDRETVKRARKQSMCYEELEVINERNGHEVLGKIQAHPTHVELVLCGGYLGCVRCGRMTSTNSGCNKLKEACRNHIPKGSEGPVRRLLPGKVPATTGEKQTLVAERRRRAYTQKGKKA